MIVSLPPNEGGGREWGLEMPSELEASENPRKWRFTWEAQSHIPILKLFLFNPEADVSLLRETLKIQLILESFLLKASWFEDEDEVLLNVPIPRVLIDAEAPFQLRTLEDHVEVKLVLLLPVDHPIIADFDSTISSSDEVLGKKSVVSVDFRPLSMDSDVKGWSSSAEGVQLYCRSCSALLTRPIKNFAEMPSTNWREAADSWFGACCCSFGGISEKLVVRYANTYASSVGMCLLSTHSVVLCKDDLLGYNFPSGDGSKKVDTITDIGNIKFSEKAIQDNRVKHEKWECCNNQKEHAVDCNIARKLVYLHPNKGTSMENLSPSELFDDVLSKSGCCADKTHVLTCITNNDSFETSGTASEELEFSKEFEFPENQKSFLNGFLGDVFMARSSNISKDVNWIEFLCPSCSSFLGAYPADNGWTLLDSRVQLFKCYISTSLPAGGSNDLLREYTLERMFANQLVESAKTEISYRTLIRDLQTKSSVLQMVLLNPNSFLQGGYFSSTGNVVEAVGNKDLFSAIKVLFADCTSSNGSQLRMIEEWVRKDQVDEVYMFGHQIEELKKNLDSAKDMFPLSCSSLQGLSLSSMMR